MRTYSVRERVLFGLLLLVFSTASLLCVYLLVIDAEFRENWIGWLICLGCWAGVAVVAHVAITGRSTRFLEQNMLQALTGQPLPPDASDDNPKRALTTV